MARDLLTTMKPLPNIEVKFPSAKLQGLSAPLLMQNIYLSVAPRSAAGLEHALSL